MKFVFIGETTHTPIHDAPLGRFSDLSRRAVTDLCTDFRRPGRGK
jgi:hypothetical protein